jgi:hypothetical protein
VTCETPAALRASTGSESRIFGVGVVEATTVVGGRGGVVEYLRQQAIQNPKAFMPVARSLLITASANHPL